MTQDELATKSGVDQRTISAIECGKIKNPSFKKVLSLAQALDVTPGELFSVKDTAA